MITHKSLLIFHRPQIIHAQELDYRHRMGKIVRNKEGQGQFLVKMDFHDLLSLNPEKWWTSALNFHSTFTIV